jgi:outer membrane protein assembly factor BamB
MNYTQLRYTPTRQCPAFDSKQEGFPALLRQKQGVKDECRFEDGMFYYLEESNLVAETIAGEARWKIRIDKDDFKTHSVELLLGGDNIFLRLKSGLYTLQKMDGANLKLLSPADTYLAEGCLGNGDLLVMQEYNGLKSLNCYSEKTNALTWSTSLPTYLNTLAANTEIVVGGRQTKIMGFERKSGALLWDFDVEEQGKVELHFPRGKVGRYPMLFGNQAIVPVNGRYVVGLDSLSGKQNWATQTQNLVMSGNTSMDEAGKVHVFSTHYSRLNAESGAMEIEYSIEPAIRKSNTGIIGDHLVVGDFIFCGSSTRQQIFRFNLKSMEFDWSHDLPARAKGAPICVDGHLLVHDDKGGLSIFSLL